MDRDIKSEKNKKVKKIEKKKLKNWEERIIKRVQTLKDLPVDLGEEMLDGENFEEEE